MKRPGYLLIEMIVALAIIAIMSIIISSMHVSIINWHKQAVHYATATNLAMTSLALAQHQIAKTPIIDGFTITIDSQVPDQSVPFILHTVTVRFKNTQGREKKVSITGGAINARS